MAILKTRFEDGQRVAVKAINALIGGRLCKVVAGGKGEYGLPGVNHTNAPTDFVYGAALQDAAAGDDSKSGVNRKSTIMLLEADENLGFNVRVTPCDAANADAANAGRIQAATGGAGENVIGRTLHAVTGGAGSKVFCVVEFGV